MPWCNFRDLCSHNELRCSKLTLFAYPFFLLILLLSFYIKYMWIPLVLFCIIFLCVSCGDWGGRRTNVQNSSQSRTNDSTVLAESSVPVAVPANQGAVDHIPSYPFERKIGSSGELVCSVCLEILQVGEMIKCLPVCQHYFHLECIDMWLDSHSTCPICRSSIEVAKTSKANEADQTESPV